MNDLEEALLAKALWQGSADVGRDLELRHRKGAVLRLSDVEAGLRHEIKVVELTPRPVLDYHRRTDWFVPGSGKAGSSIHEPLGLHVPLVENVHEELVHPCDYPVDVLVLRLRYSRGTDVGDPRAHVWPQARAWSPDDEDLSRFMYPTGLVADVDARHRIVTLRVERALADLVYRLVWGQSLERAGVRRPSLPVLSQGPWRRRVFAALAKQARERSGLSARDLAVRMGVSHVTILETERGRDARASTLRRYLRALPELTPQEVLPTAEAPGPVSTHDAWEYYRDLHGLEAELVRKTLVITEDGDAECRYETRNLRDLRTKARDIRMILGLPRTLLHNSPFVLKAVETDLEEADEDSLRTRVIGVKDGKNLHELRIPGRLSKHGLTHVQRWESPRMFAMTADRARERRRKDTSYVAGTSHFSSVPARRLVNEVRFPKSYWPQDVWCVAWPAAQQPSTESTGLLDEIHAGRYAMSSSTAKGGATLTVEEPLMGVKYGIAWRLPKEWKRADGG